VITPEDINLDFFVGCIAMRYLHIWQFLVFSVLRVVGRTGPSYIMYTYIYIHIYTVFSFPQNRSLEGVLGSPGKSQKEGGAKSSGTSMGLKALKRIESFEVSLKKRIA